MRGKSGWIIAGAATYIAGSTATFIYLRGRKNAHEHACTAGPIWDSLADTYDSQVGLDETLMGLTLLRRYVIRQAQASPAHCLPPPLGLQQTRLARVHASQGVMHAWNVAPRYASSDFLPSQPPSASRCAATNPLTTTQGDVLEMSAGTGRNMPYYRWDKLRSLTVTDTSRHMLFHAKQKVRRHQRLPASTWLALMAARQ